MAEGRLILLEGIDGSGKSSQYRRLSEKLNRDGIPFYKIVFPRYEKESSALIRMYLNGEFGSKPEDVNAYTASMFFAVDRFASYRDDWGKVYESGGLIISDRYTTSNMVHQGAKLRDGELPYFFNWLADLEYGKMGLPEPDSVIYLDVDVSISLSRMQRRRMKDHSTGDIHENDIEYLKRCITVADKACEHFSWDRINYLKDGCERSLEEKNEEIYKLVLSKL